MKESELCPAKLGHELPDDNRAPPELMLETSLGSGGTRLLASQRPRVELEGRRIGRPYGKCRKNGYDEIALLSG